MNPGTVEQRVIRCFRDSWPSSAQTNVSLQEPLGEIGFGLDSLAFVEFMTSVEREFGVAIDESYWTDRNRLTLGVLVELVAQAPARASSAKRVERYRPPPGARVTDKLVGAVRTLGWLQGARWIARGAAARLQPRVFERYTHVVLCFELAPFDDAHIQVPHDVEVRVARPADVAALEMLYRSEPRTTLLRKTKAYLDRMRAGCVCLLASWRDRVVGIDWIAVDEQTETETGLTFKMQSGTCYGFDLYEHPEFAGKGIGLKLLASSLVEARRRGFERQITVVHAQNRRMLSASVHLLGAERIGSIATTRYLGRPTSAWQVEDKRGRGGRVLV